MYLDRENRTKHWYFEPSNLPEVVNYLEMDAELISLLIQAHRALGRLEGMSQYVPNMEQLEGMVIRNEACMSCAIDNFSISCAGTLDDTIDTVSKRFALNLFRAAKTLGKQSISVKLLCMLHGTVMNGFSDQQIGKFRRGIVVIHPDFAVNMQEYNPPLPTDLTGLLDAMIKFARTEDKIDPLIKAALVYYQFETIYPFDIGNGLVGRLLPNLVLMQEGILSRPLLALSDYFYKHEHECAQWFMRIQHFGRYVGWIKFFIQGVITSVEHTISQINLATSLREENLRKITLQGKSATVLFAIYEQIERQPVVSIQNIADIQNISYNTATKYVKMMEELSILKQMNEQSRYRLFAHTDFMELFKKY